MTYGDAKIKYELLKKVSGLTLPRKVSVAIARNIMRFEEELKIYEQQDADIAHRYAAKDEKGDFILDGSSYTFETPENRKDFIRERDELNDTEADIQIAKFQASELERCDESERYDIMTPLQEASIGWMIDYEDKEAE